MHPTFVFSSNLLPYPSRLLAELENHLGIADKTLSEFVIELSKGKRDAKEFRASLAKEGAEMPDALAETLWNIIQKLMPGQGRDGGGAGSGSRFVPRPGEKYAGLAQPDDRERIRQMEAEMLAEGEARRREQEARGPRDGEGAMPPPPRRGEAEDGRGGRQGGRDRREEGGRDRREEGDGRREREQERGGSDDEDRRRDRKRRRSRSRSRDRNGLDRDYERGRERGREWERDRDRERGRERDREGDRERERERQRSGSPVRGGAGGGSRGRSPPRAPPPAMPEEPEMYAVYRARVSGVMDFGCFVELQGFRKKVEGLVHLSNISSTKKGGSAKEMVQKGA
jgi:ATP-dependent RNA helicase DHX8/PRP22